MCVAPLIPIGKKVEPWGGWFCSYGWFCKYSLDTISCEDPCKPYMMPTDFLSHHNKTRLRWRSHKGYRNSSCHANTYYLVHPYSLTEGRGPYHTAEVSASPNYPWTSLWRAGDSFKNVLGWPTKGLWWSLRGLQSHIGMLFWKKSSNAKFMAWHA